MSVSVTIPNPVERMLAAVLAAGECLNVPAAHFSSRWVVRLGDGTELHFAEPTGNRLMLRGMIDRHPTEKPGAFTPTVRFVPVAGANGIQAPATKPTPAPQKTNPIPLSKHPPKRRLTIEERFARHQDKAARKAARAAERQEIQRAAFRFAMNAPPKQAIKGSKAKLWWFTPKPKMQPAPAEAYKAPPPETQRGANTRTGICQTCQPSPKRTTRDTAARTGQHARVIPGHKWEPEPESAAIAAPYVPPVPQSTKPIKQELIAALEGAWMALIARGSAWETMPGAVRFQLLQAAHGMEPAVLLARSVPRLPQRA